jgi:hypothetical protein
MTITVGGKPLKEFLKEEEDLEYKANIIESLSEFAGLKKSIYKPPLPVKRREYYGHSRVRIIKPEAKMTTVEKVLTALYEKDRSGKEICSVIGQKSGAVSGMMHRMLENLNGHLEKAKGEPPEKVVWKLNAGSLSVQDLVELYEKSKRRKKERKDPPLVFPHEKMDWNKSNDIPEEKPENILNDILSKVLGIKIEITCNIEIRFGFTKE